MAKKRESGMLVLDTSAFIAGFEPLSVEAVQYSVPEVKNELATHSLPLTRFNAAVENGILKVRLPKHEYVLKILKSSKTAGDLHVLSIADRQVLALALELKEAGFNPSVITDDYSMQNVANLLKVDFAPLLTFGIRYRFLWKLYCPACYRKYPSDYNSKHCEVCGTKLKRKPKKKTPI